MLLTRLRIYKHKEEAPDRPRAPVESNRPPPRTRRKSAHENAEIAADSLEEDPTDPEKTHPESPNNTGNISTVNNEKKEPKPSRESLRSRAAVFEANNQRFPTRCPSRDAKQTEHAKNTGRFGNKEILDDLRDLDFIRHKREEDFGKDERRRHTYDSRERETDADRLRRISLENRSPK